MMLPAFPVRSSHIDVYRGARAGSHAGRISFRKADKACRAAL